MGLSLTLAGSSDACSKEGELKQVFPLLVLLLGLFLVVFVSVLSDGAVRSFTSLPETYGKSFDAEFPQAGLQPTGDKELFISSVVGKPSGFVDTLAVDVCIV